MKVQFVNVQHLAEEVFAAMVASRDTAWAHLTWEGMAEAAFEGAEVFAKEAERRFKLARSAADKEQAERALEASMSP